MILERLVLPGNCYIWAHILKFFYGGEIFFIMGPFGPNEEIIKHYMIRDKYGTVRHFKRYMDFLPAPFCYFIFLGVIERSGKRRVKKKKRRCKKCVV